MNNFDFGWFLTVPGLLITGGVILLTISLVILLLSIRKSKKVKNPLEDGANSTTESVVTTDSNMSGLQTSPVGATVSIDTTQPTVNPTVNPVTPTPSVSPIVSNEPQVVDPATVMKATANTDLTPAVPVIPAPEYNAMSNTNSVDTSAAFPTTVNKAAVNSQTIATAPEVKPMEVKPTLGVSPVNPETPIKPAVSTQPQSTIYGGANPTIPTVSINANSNHQIYGGANPLENTQNTATTSTPSVPRTNVVAPNVGVANVHPTPVISASPINNTSTGASINTNHSVNAAAPTIPSVQSVNTPPVVPTAQPVTQPMPSVQPVAPAGPQQPVTQPMPGVMTNNK